MDVMKINSGHSDKHKEFMMKNFILLSSLLYSAVGFSQTVKEFDETEEKQCHQELKLLGCVNSKGEEDNACAEAKKAKLTKMCASMHEEKKN
jgi:hypothetical protein